MEKLIILIALEAIIFCIIGLHGIRWNKKLNKYLKENHLDYYNSIINVPILAGGPDILRKHYRAVKAVYWGNMPDELSTHYQKKASFFAKTGIVWLLLLFATMISPLFFYLY